MAEICGRLSSFLSMSMLDGEGVRCVAFLQGCPLRCAYCHNPDTWEKEGGSDITARELFGRIQRYRRYFGRKGGITLSGGEVLMQPEFAAEVFSLCKNAGINTAIETSGCITNEKTDRLLRLTDHCMLDVKMTDEQSYKKYTNGSLEQTLRFLQRLEELSVRTWVRQVIVPTVNDTQEQVKRLKALVSPFSCVEKIQLLPFRKLCESKYEKLGMEFPMKNIPEASPELISRLEKILDET